VICIVGGSRTGAVVDYNASRLGYELEEQPMTLSSDQAKIYDITWPVSPAVVGWPGDTPTQVRAVLQQATGDSVNVCRLTLSPHTGSHADAPYHYDPKGATIEQVDPRVFLGPARLVDVRGRSPIRARDLGDLQHTSRLLLRTGGWNDPSRFPESIPVMHREVPDYLRQSGIQLVGLDVPSVDVLDSKQLPIHHALGRYGIHILEGLDLREPPPGQYELIALPLKITGADGAPVRAVLRPLR
jgi:arylformamidase